MYGGVLPWALGCCAALIVGLSKTAIPGIGILATALMVSVFPAKESVGALLPMLIVGDVFAVAYYRRHAEWRKLLELFPSVIAGMAAGGVVLALMSSEQLEPFLGALILVLLLLDMARRRFGWSRMPHQAWFVITCGGLAGFATTVGNVAGPIMNIYLISKGLDKERFLGTSAWYYLIINCSKVPIFSYLGMISGSSLLFDALMVPGIVVGAVVGRFVVRRMRPEVFTFLVFALAAVAAVKLLF